MIKTFLITTPNYDDAVGYCSKWSGEIIETAQSKGFDVIVLDEKKANPKEFESRLKSSDPVFVMFNGHGMATEICGHKNAVLLKYSQNESLMKGRVIYARSCYSLSTLGKSCADKGARAFVGYSLPFMFISDPNRSFHPLKDELAAPCFVSSNSIPLALLKGNTVKDAITRGKEQIDKQIALWKTRNVMEATMVVACLMWNKRGLGFHGNENATVS
jgi:hypothetical protein